MSPVQNPHTPHHAITLQYHIRLPHHVIASHHRITPSRHNVTALHHRITPPRHNVNALHHRITPPRHNTRNTRSTRITAYTVGRRFKPISFPKSAMRHSRATLKAYIVPQQSRTTLSGDITAPKRSSTVPRDTLGRHHSPQTFPNRAAQHPWATLCLFSVAETYALIPS